MENLKWHEKPTIVILLLIFFFPLGLYFMWKNNLWSNKVRIIVTIVIAALVIGQIGKDKQGGNSSLASLENSASLDSREAPLSNKEIAGIYKGSQPLYGGSTYATKLEVNEDGSFTALTYIGGELAEGTWKGSFETNVVKDEKKEYGEVVDLSYSHRISFNANTEYGIRKSVYLINNNLELVPIESFFEESGTLKRE